MFVETSAPPLLGRERELAVLDDQTSTAPT
jgi:hypothetical protein